jgi:hypothetical protein
MISNLLILNSAYVGSRDLWWVDAPEATVGYNIYRAFDYPANWVKLNTTPQPGHFYRDISSLQSITYTVQAADWVEKGEFGKWGFRIPDVPYSNIVKGRPVVCDTPEEITVILDGNSFRPVMVNGLDQTIWLRMDNTLPIGGKVSAYPLVADLTTVSVFQVTYNRLTNFVDIFNNMRRTFYTIVPVNGSGETIAAGASGNPVVDSNQIDTMDYLQAEMVRRNAWLFEQTGEPAYLLIKKSRGTLCGCTNTGVQMPRTGCSSCFETGWIGGYYGPYDVLFIDPDVAALRTLNEGGVKVERNSRSYFGPTPIVQNGDLIVRRNGERLVIHTVTYKMPRGVLLQQEFNVELLNTKDTRYLIPLGNSSPFDSGGTHNPLCITLLMSPTPLMVNRLWENR